jgi:AmmeMemoRadiSam system protein B
MEEKVSPREVRESPIAGSWYPGKKEQLTTQIERFLAGVPPEELPSEIVGLISPHAGYAYSGQVAAWGYKQLTGKSYDIVAVVSPSHAPQGGGVLVTRFRYYRTPLGLVEVAHDLVAEMAGEAHLCLVEHDEEHSLEIQLPFLQYTLGGFRLIPVMLEDQSYATASHVAGALTRVLEGKSALLVASTDLSHFYPYEQAVALDQRTVEAIGRFDPEGFDRDVNAGLLEACGYGAVVAVLLAAKARGAKRAVVLKYANSGDVTGDRHSVVGYASLALTAG